MDLYLSWQLCDPQCHFPTGGVTDRVPPFLLCARRQHYDVVAFAIQGKSDQVQTRFVPSLLMRCCLALPLMRATLFLCVVLRSSPAEAAFVHCAVQLAVIDLLG